MRLTAASTIPLVLSCVAQCADALTIHQVAATTTSTADLPTETQQDEIDYSGLPAYDPLTLEVPAPPEQPLNNFVLSVPPTEQALNDGGRSLSVEQKGNFLGFSIELSVASSIMGTSATNLKVPFLNYLANIRNRAGQGAIVRIGGNTQEASTYFSQGLTDGAMIEKIYAEGAAVTGTPTINYSPDLFYAMANVSSLVGTEWYFGLPFNQSAVENQIENIPEIVSKAQEVLGDKLLGLQMGNEPDLYARHGKRNGDYSVGDFNNEFRTTKEMIQSQANLAQQSFLVGPSVCCNVEGFLFDDVLNAGFLTENADSLATVAVQHYPNNNCKIDGKEVNPQDIFAEYLNHTMANVLTDPYVSGTDVVLNAGKSIMMMEFGSASCGGFPGLSDSFGAALWTADYALKMASRSFSSALMHVGGQNVYYNAFTPPPTNLSRIGYQWTTGSPYYPTLIVAELLGPTNKSRIVDLTDDDKPFHPVYAVYENGAPARLGLFNFVSDASGAHDTTVTVDLGGQTLPRGTVDVRYFSAASVAEKYEIYWAGQTLRSSFASDGRMYGELETITVQCNTETNSCDIPLKAPSLAVVFLTDDSLNVVDTTEEATSTFATTVVNIGSGTIDAGALETGNGISGRGGDNGAMQTAGGASMTSIWTIVLSVTFGLLCIS